MRSDYFKNRAPAKVIMKKYWIIIIAALILLGVVFVILRGKEDTWIKDSRGVWVKHGVPSTTPNYVSEQQSMIIQAQQMYQKAKSLGEDFSNGPCLGNINSDWVADVAHSPRQAVDNQPQNQCPDYLSGKAHHFIELDPNGEIIKVQ